MPENSNGNMRRQRRWQLKQVALGKCEICGKKRKHYKARCDACAIKTRNYQRERLGCVVRYKVRVGK